MLESLVLRWGYLAVGVGTFFEGESVLLAGGAFAHRGLLSLPLVIAAAFVGSVAGDQLWFRLGRRYGRGLIERRPHLHKHLSRTEGWLQRHGSLFVLGFRFIYGIRTVTPVLLGASRYPAWRFTALDLLGGALWSTTFGCAGFGLGAGLKAILGRATRIEELLAGLAVLVIALLLGARLLRRGRG